MTSSAQRPVELAAADRQFEVTATRRNRRRGMGRIEVEMTSRRSDYAHGLSQQGGIAGQMHVAAMSHAHGAIGAIRPYAHLRLRTVQSSIRIKQFGADSVRPPGFLDHS